MAVSTWSYVGYFATTASGLLLATQPATTAALAKHTLASFASLISFLTGLVVVAVYFAIEYSLNVSIGSLKTVPWWAWTGGIVGAIYIITISLFTRHLGALVVISIIIASQVVLSAMIDHFGWLQMPERRMTWERGFGVVFILIGVTLMTVNSRPKIQDVPPP